LIITLTILLGVSGLSFASKESDGEKLQRAGFIAGDTNGNLMESNMLSRAELTVMVAELNGVKENAKTYAIQSTFSDVNPNEWYGPYVAYAEKEGWFKGDSNGNFNPNDSVSNQMMATVMLRTLEYESTWNTAISDAQSIGVPVNSQLSNSMTRGEAFSSLWRVVNTPKNRTNVALGVELGKLEARDTTIDIKNYQVATEKLDVSNSKVSSKTYKYIFINEIEEEAILFEDADVYYVEWEHLNFMNQQDPIGDYDKFLFTLNGNEFSANDLMAKVGWSKEDLVDEIFDAGSNDYPLRINKGEVTYKFGFDCKIYLGPGLASMRSDLGNDSLISIEELKERYKNNPMDIEVTNNIVTKITVFYTP